MGRIPEPKPATFCINVNIVCYIINNFQTFFHEFIQLATIMEDRKSGVFLLGFL